MYCVPHAIKESGEGLGTCKPSSKQFSAFAMRSDFQIKNSSNKNSGKVTIPCGNFKSTSHQTVHAPLSCSYHLAHSFLNVYVVNLTAHSHCPLLYIYIQDGNTAFDIASAEGHMDVCQELLAQHPHELHLTSVIFYLCIYITNKTCVVPVL